MDFTFFAFAFTLVTATIIIFLWRTDRRHLAEMQGYMRSMAKNFGVQQAEMNHSIREQTRSTYENLSKLQERLAIIDRAQANLQSLSECVIEFQSILSNKQIRGVFGQGRMESIIADALPPWAYSFQAMLPNGTRPDCLVHMPNSAPALVIDSKFPLESWNAMQKSDTTHARQEAENRFRRDIEKHIYDIEQKYFIPGKTQDTAFLFIPSESIFATIHEKFEAVIQKATQKRIIIVSPSLLMLSVQVIHAILKDNTMRAEAHRIQSEVKELVKDVTRLDTRVRRLQSHFKQAEKDVDEILTSASKIVKRSEKIEQLDLPPLTKESKKNGHILAASFSQEKGKT